MLPDASQYYEWEGTGGPTVIRVLDPLLLAEQKDLFYGLVDRLANAPEPRQVALNLANLHVIRSTMIGVLINFQRKLKDAGGSVKLCCIDPDVLNVFNLTRMDQIFDIRKSERDAIDAFQGRSRGGWISRIFGRH
jgi:anti-sigma B factor antagonist